MSSYLEESIYLITSQDANNDKFGTGFVIHQDETFTYILTCAHVVRDVGGIDQVEVECHQATVIARSPDGHADDLALLRVNGLLDASFLPLGTCGEKGSLFRIHGYWLHDKRNKLYRLEEIIGYLEKSVKLTARSQQGKTDAWVLKVNDDSTLLQPGFSGSPVIDSKSRIVLGVVSHREDQGRIGQAVFVRALKKIWSDMPPSLLRKNLYDLQEISNFLKSIFNNYGEFLKFCIQYFPSLINDDDPFLWQIEYLIDYCHQQDKIEQLLELIESINKKQYHKFISLIKRDSSQSTFFNQEYSSSLCAYIHHFITFPLKEAKSEKRSQAELDINSEISKFIPKKREAFIRASASELDIPPEKIKILSIRKGSIKLKVEIPSNALDKLIELYQYDRVRMRDLGILYVTETFDEAFNFNNIRTLLDKGFTHEELVVICNQFFRSVAEQLLLDSDKVEIINRLIEYVRQESQTPDLLRIAEERQPQAYKKFGSYYNIPRRPSTEVRQRSTSSRRRSAFSGLTRWEILMAGVMGAGVGALGFIIMIFAAILLELITQSSTLLPLLLLVILLVLGDIVGKVVSIGVKRKGGEAVGRLAIASYLVGLALLPIGLPLLIALVSFVFILFTNPREAPGAALGIFFLIIDILVRVVLNMVNPLNGFSTAVTGLAGGSYLAYQRAR